MAGQPCPFHELWSLVPYIIQAGDPCHLFAVAAGIALPETYYHETKYGSCGSYYPPIAGRRFCLPVLFWRGNWYSRHPIAGIQPCACIDWSDRPLSVVCNIGNKHLSYQETTQVTVHTMIKPIILSIMPVMAGMIISCQGRMEKTKPVVEKITESVYASGIVKSSNQYDVFSTVNGVVAKKLVKEGDIVHKGQAVLQLLDVTARLNTENARIAADYALKAANARRLAALRLDIDQAKLVLDNDALLLERQRNLWSQQIGTYNALEQRELAWKTARNNYEATCLRYAELQRSINFQEKQAFKNVEISRSLASDYTIKSGYNGKVYNVLVEEGEMVNTQQPVAVIGDAASFLLELQVDEYDIGRIKPAQKIIVSMDSYRGQVFEAEVIKVRPLMHDRSKTFTVEARFLQSPPVLYPNLTCEANIIISRKEGALTIPRSWLLEGGFVLLANKEKRKVATGLMDYQKVEITAGLSANDLIIKPAP